jgi:DNA-binding IclR family transcriptional regulator
MTWRNGMAQPLSLDSPTGGLPGDSDPIAAPDAVDWPALPSSVVKSAGRVLQILEYFDDIHRSAKMVDIARALHYPESSTSLLLRSLVVIGYLDYDRRKRTYHPTRRVRLLGNWVDAPLFRNDRILRLMEDLNAETADTIILASRNGLNAQYIHVVQAQTALRLHLPPGTVRPLVASATGWVLLSSLPDLEIAALVRRANASAPSSEAMVRVPELIRRVEAIRTLGYVATPSSITPGASIIAMPLPQTVTNSPLAIAIGNPSSRMEPRTPALIELLDRRIKERLSA